MESKFSSVKRRTANPRCCQESDDQSRLALCDYEIHEILHTSAKYDSQFEQSYFAQLDTQNICRQFYYSCEVK